MPRCHLGSCIFHTDSRMMYGTLNYDTYTVLNRVEVSSAASDDIVRSDDRALHRSLGEIFRERCLSSGQIRELLRAPDDSDRLFMVKLILSRRFTKEELRKFSLLWIAILGCYQDTAELLVRSGADVNELFGCRNAQAIDEKWTVLHLLVHMDSSSENERLIRLVTDHGADLQARDSMGGTALHFAAALRRVRIIEMFLRKGVDVNIVDDDSGSTAFLIAASRSVDDELLPLLMKHGADVFAKDIHGRNALHQLALAPVEHTDLARVLIERGVSLHDRHRRDQYQPIHIAAYEGKNELVKLFLDHGANVNALAHYGYFPLFLAAISPECNTVLVMKTLLERGANVNQKTSYYGRTALHEVCGNNFDAEAIRMLLYAGADILSKDYYVPFSDTPLHLLDSLHRDSEKPSVELVLKTLALKKVCLRSSESMDESLIQQYPEFWNYYRGCVEQLERAKLARFAGTCTFFDLLEKCHCEISALMRSPEFKINFKKYDMTEFARYAEEIVRAFESAEKHYHSVLEQENVIDEAVYGLLPYIIVRRVTHYILNCENLK